MKTLVIPSVTCMHRLC